MYKIMIVEDDPTIWEIIDQRLQKWGYQTYRAQDYQNIVAEFTRYSPHQNGPGQTQQDMGFFSPRSWQISSATG